METVFITGADRGVGFALCQEFLAHGYRVFAGQFMPQWKELEQLSAVYPTQLTCIPLDVSSTQSVRQAAQLTARHCDRLDILVNCAGILGSDDLEGMARVANVNTFGPLRMTEAFLPLMEGGKKRLCYISSEAGSLTLLHREEGYSYCCSKTMLNMAVRLMFNHLRKQGYTFRLYHPGWVRTYINGAKTDVGNFDAEETAAVAFGQFTDCREWEDALVMTDVSGHAWPF